MLRIYQKSVLTALLLLFTQQLIAQKNDTIPVSVNPAMLEIFNSKYPKTYTIAGITVVGSKAFDQNLIISISGIAVGDKVQLPGSDAFGKAISKLWKQITHLHHLPPIQVILTYQYHYKMAQD